MISIAHRFPRTLRAHKIMAAAAGAGAAPAVLQGVNNHPCAPQLGGSPHVYTEAYSVYAHDRVSGLNNVPYCWV